MVQPGCYWLFTRNYCFFYQDNRLSYDVLNVFLDVHFHHIDVDLDVFPNVALDVTCHLECYLNIYLDVDLEFILDVVLIVVLLSSANFLLN